MFTQFNHRTTFYVAWSLSDLACDTSGLGFNGYDLDGRPKWDLLENFNFKNIEVKK